MPDVADDDPLIDVLEPEVEVAALGSILITAKSTVPEAGLNTMSEMVPIKLPVEPCTCAPMSWLPRTAFPLRPVAL